MTQMRLVGLVSMAKRELTQSMFLIPFFKSPEFNWHFAQELDAAKRIVAFKRFDPFQYHIVKDRFQEEVLREVGDLGIMAYYRESESIVFDDATEIVRRIRARPPVSGEPPFFSIDACYLVQDFTRLRVAIRRASKLLAQNQAAWQEIEMNSAASFEEKLEKQDSATQDEIEHLEKNFDSEQWVLNWRALWRAAPFDERLIEVALKYIAHLGGNDAKANDTATLLSVFLSDRRQLLEASRSEEIILSARSFVEAGDRRDVLGAKFGDKWARVVRGLMSAKVALSDASYNALVEYLQKTASSEKFVPVSWARNWLLLWKSDAHRRDAIELLRRVESTIFQPACSPQILSALSKQLEDHDVRNLVESALQETTQANSNAWIASFIQILRLTNGEKKWVELGLQWLRGEGGHLRRWPDVFEAISGYLRHSDLSDLKRDWLLRANKGMSNWPKEARDYLAGHADDGVMAAVRRWLINPSRTAKKSDIESLSLLVNSQVQE